MVDRPILFSAPMVRALLGGRKTQTRRIIKPQPPEIVTSAGVISRSGEGQTDEWSWLSGDPRDIDTWGFEGDFKTRFVPGDRLWVKETWGCHFATDDQKPSKIDADLWSVRYFADDHIRPASRDGSLALLEQCKKKRVAIFMPRWASRLTLVVSDVRVERLQDIGRDDAIAEGVAEYPCEGPHRGPDATFWTAERGHPEHGARTTPVEAYRALWNTINGESAWEANPWVVAISFVVEPRTIG